MNEFNGVVQRHSTKNWGTKVFYSFTLSGVDGFFNTGTRKPPAEGSTVSFTAAPNARGFMEVDTKTIQYKADGEPAVASIAAVKAKGKSAEEKGFWERKEAREVHNDAARELGASRNTAIAIVDLILKYEAVKLPAKQAEKEGVIWELVEHYTSKLMGKEVSTDTVSAEPATPAEDDNWT